ncbi:MAG TPA: COX aromatic rich motif-containing protein [Candidatus Saccharimonadales bacterium]|nr:COX aromatic rich motif-containing protein [Candidatus Saccharimonadales bacterium]
MGKNRKKNGWSTAGPILLVLAGLAVLITLLLRDTNVALFNSKGLIADEQQSLMLLTVGIMLILGIPAVCLIYFTAWRYRESNTRPARNPNAGHGKLLNASMWLVPGAIALVLAMILWPATHHLAPQKQIAAEAKPLTIQVVALRWKWLFIYPEQKIATVNYVQVPVGTPVTFELTADEAPMSSFWIPNLGGMLYAMTGHVNRLNLLATVPGDYPGSSAEINGAGFAGMKFTASATSKETFDQWVRDVSLTAKTMDGTEYDKLLKPSENNPSELYSLLENDLYDKVVMKYMGSHEAHTDGAHH